MMKPFLTTVAGLPYCFAGFFLLAACPAAGQLPPFEQDPLDDGVVSIEAENYHALSPGSGAAVSSSWQRVENGGYAGGAGMAALPNDAVRINSSWTTLSPALHYQVHFNKTGTHYLVARAVGATGDDDSCHIGLNGQEVATGYRLQEFCCDLRWSGDTPGNVRATFEVPAPGVHTVDIYMREDGLEIDKFIITTNPDLFPEEAGPPQSLQGTNAAQAAGAGGVAFVEFAKSNTAFSACFEPAASVDAYRLVYGFPGGPMVQVPGGQVAGFDATAPVPGDGVLFYGVEGVGADTNRILTDLLISRMTYGPTPGLLDAVLGMGPDAFLQQQLASEMLAEGADGDPAVAALAQLLEQEAGALSELQAWYLLRAIAADRQFLEVLTQFFNNHFVTYFWKSRNWFREQGLSNDEAYPAAASLEYRELKRWREVLLDPNGTFHDLLRISAESPAMIIYLDTVENVAANPNENYARELLELFTMGVDNGYDQDDIEEMARCWTGWTVAEVHPDDVDDPFAPAYSNKLYLLQEQSTGWSYRKGFDEPDAGWREVSFTESTNWLSGQTSIGMGDGDDNTELTDMRYNYSSVYLRHPFVVNDLAEVPALQLRLYLDDGCVVWINGQEVMRANVPDGPLAYDSTAESWWEADWFNVLVTNAPSVLTTGTNLLAIHALNVTLNNNDLSVDAELRVPGVWSFVFDSGNHDASNKVLFAGKTVDPRFGAPHSGASYELALDGTNGIVDGYAILDHLANLPYTQEYLSTKLCQLLVHDDFDVGGYYNITQISPEAALLKDCMAAWEAPAPGDGRKGNIRQVLATILASDLFRGQAASRQKVKTPFEYVVSAVRALRADLGGGVYTASSDGYDLVRPMDNMGMEVFANWSPDGWPEVGVDWIDTSTVSERMRFVQNLLMSTNEPAQDPAYDWLKQEDYGWNGADNLSDPVALLVDRIPAQVNDAVAVTDFFLDLLFPAEGEANLYYDREIGISLLNSDETGDPGSSPFNLLSSTSAEYDRRVRGLVGLLLASPRFNEQ